MKRERLFEGFMMTYARHFTALVLMIGMVWSSLAGGSQAAQIAGYVYTRSPILSESGNRIWCEYAQDGSIVRDLAEATGEYDPALGCLVLSGQEFNSHCQAYQGLQASYPGLGLPLSRQDYLAGDFFTAGGEPIVKPSLRASTNFVVVLPQEMRLLADPDQLILSEYPVDPTAVVPPTACSLLIGADGDILVWSNNRIGFKAGFLSSEQGGVYDPDQYRLRKSTDTIHGPIEGVWVERPGYNGTYTDDQGRYTLRWYSIPCPYSGYTISSYATARLYSRRFNPKAGSGPRPYYVFRTFTEACSPGPLNFEHLYTFGFMTGSLASPSSMGNHVTYPDALDFLVDTTILAGRAYLSQGQGRVPEVIPVGQGTAYGLSGFAPQRSSSAYYDFDGDGSNDTVVVGSLQADPEDPQSTIFVPEQEDTPPEALVQGVYLSASGKDPAEGQPDFTRVMDWTPNVGHEGLLTCISTGDLMNTDLYVFRVSDGKLITERVGLRQEDVGGLDWGVDGAQARYFYRMEMRGSSGDFQHNLSQSMANYADWQAESGMNPELFEQRADHIKPGDRIRIVAINRTSGYTGSVYTDMQSPGSSGGADLSFEIDEIVMTPANLKVWVERDYNITAGLSRGEIRREQIIGFEGAGLSSDTFIAVHTEWLDAGGSPLPEELSGAGFTGRLVCLSGDKQLPGNEGGGLYHFAIDPGRHIQVLQIPQDRLSSQHFYIQVSGEPISGTPVFYNNVSRGSPDFTSTGANPGKLSSRPDRYVPFLVPVFDEEATEIRRQAYREALAGNPGAIKPEPLYRWCYRPEMQYSLYDLEVGAINRQIDEATSENILESDSIISCEDDWAEILYSLSTTDLLPMDYIDLAGDKELVFSVGGQEVMATIGSDQSIRFDNLAHLALLDADDFLTIRLATNNDAGNVLWEYALFTPGKIVVKNDAEDEGVEEICLSNRVNLRKRYHIELPDIPPSYDLKKLHGYIRVVDREGKVVTVSASESPGDTKYAAVEYPLEFVREGERVCAVIKVDENDTRGRCIFTNLALDIIADDDDDGYYYADQGQTAMMYGGVGGRVQIDVNITRHEVPMEPLGVIVIGIDGLRRDVLYPGVNLPDGDYHIGDLSALPGIGGIMAGHEAEESRRYVMLDNVTAIFPSITLASWASIFTGRMPAETGIMGNEFFARDLLDVDDGVINSVPPMFGNPKGLISFSSGAFRGYDSFGKLDLIGDEFFIPRSSGADAVSVEGTPQNHPELYRAETVYERLGAMEGLRDYYEKAGGDATVVVHSHYGRGADRWLTWDLEVAFGESELLEQMSWDKMNDYLEYFEAEDGIRFPALTVWYLPGLDHQAHKEGMGAYRDFLIETTDGHIADVVGSLRELDEFDNKLFIIVSDHGMTGMPVNLKYKHRNWLGAEVEKEADVSCKMNVKFVDPDNPKMPLESQKAERTNNNLHIWELAEGLRNVGSIGGEQGLSFAVLAPQEVAKLYDEYSYGAKSDLESANLIAALNGPMAYLYIKNRATNSWEDKPREIEDVGYVAELLRLMFTEDKSESSLPEVFTPGVFDKAIPSVSGMKRLAKSIDKILIRQGDGYVVFQGLGRDYASINMTEPRYVRAAERIGGLCSTDDDMPDRSGDIVLLFRSFTDEYPENRFTCGVACKAWHGSLNPGDSYVPFILAYPGGNAAEVERLREGIGDCPEGGSYCEECACGNWKVTDVIMQVIQKQYGGENGEN